MEYGSIQISGGSTAQGSIGTSWVKLTGFDTIGPANGVGVNHGVDELNVESDGAYYAFAHLGFAGTLDAAYTFAILVDDVASGVQGNQDVSSTATGTSAGTRWSGSRPAARRTRRSN